MKTSDGKRKENNELRNNLDKLHTTELGAVRIKRNLSLYTDDIVQWCKDKIKSSNAHITRKGKNWYIDTENCILTVNAYSYTVITGHKKKGEVQGEGCTAAQK